MTYAIYLTFTDRYGNPQPEISEEGLQWVGEANDAETAFLEFADHIGIDTDRYGWEDFAYIELPAGASEWSNDRVNEAALKTA